MTLRQTAPTRREFMGRCAAISAISLVSPLAAWAADDDSQRSQWQAMSEDPVYKMISGTPDLDKILTLFPRTTGKPAFDPERIAENVQKLETTPAVNTGHPFLDLSVKVGLAHIDPTFRGDHPRYGVGTYGARDPRRISAHDHRGRRRLVRLGHHRPGHPVVPPLAGLFRSRRRNHQVLWTVDQRVWPALCTRPRSWRKGPARPIGGPTGSARSIEWPNIFCNFAPRPARTTA